MIETSPASASASARYILWAEGIVFQKEFAALRAGDLAPLIPRMSARLLSFLCAAKISSRSDIANLTRGQILSFPNMGKKTLAELEVLLAATMPKRELNIGETITGGCGPMSVRLRITRVLGGEYYECKVE